MRHRPCLEDISHARLATVAYPVTIQFVLFVDIVLVKGMINMTQKNYSLIAVLAAIVMIPQLLFWWLAPMEAQAYWAVYIGGTILSIGIPLVCFITYWKSNLRKTTGVSIIAGIIEIAIVCLSAMLLIFDASVRSTVFAYMIAVLLCLIVLVPFISSVMKAPQQGLSPISVPVEEHFDNVSQPRERIETADRPFSNRQLPPRNR